MEHMDDPNSLWSIRPVPGESCKQGSPLRSGAKIRLTHSATGKNLHTHLFQSPLSKNQEVTGFGENGEGDTGDFWVVEVASGSTWRRDEPVRFRHVDTRAFLKVTSRNRFDHGNCGGNCPIMGQLEAFAAAGADEDALWRTAEGVYFPVTSGR